MPIYSRLKSTIEALEEEKLIEETELFGKQGAYQTTEEGEEVLEKKNEEVDELLKPTEST